MQLGLPLEGKIFLFAARGGRGNRYKDFKTIESVLKRLKELRPQELLQLIVLGERSESLKRLGFPVQFEEVNRNPARMALFYQAADLYLHAANAENYPTVILESMACGTPVVATETGGIPEQIEEGIDGLLVRPHDSEAMAERIHQLLSNPEELRSMGARALEKARQQFDQKTMTQAYLDWYQSSLRPLAST